MFECGGFDKCPAQTSPELRIDLVLPVAKIIKLVCLSHSAVLTGLDSESV